MKISFSNYTYYDPNNKNQVPTTAKEINKYKFDNDTFQRLISKRRYKDAANYASQFHFNDPNVQKEHENDILNLKREGRKLEAIYGNIKDDDVLNKIEFFDNVFVDGGIENIENNPYSKKFSEFKKNLGSSFKMNSAGLYTDEIEKEATTIAFTFQPEKQTLFGIDWLAKDNTAYSIETFYNNSGFNEAQLKSAGVEILHKDGRTTLKFNKDNPLANKIIYNIPTGGYKGDIHYSSSHDVIIEGYTSDGTRIKNVPVYSRDLNKIQDFISDSENAKLNAFKDIGSGEKDYSSTIGPSLDDNLEYLNQALATGQIDETTYNRQLKLSDNILNQAIVTLGSGNYEMFSNAYNDESTDETLIPLDNTQRSEIIQSISASNPKNIHFNAMISNGQIGTLVTINADEVDSKDISDDEDINKVKRRRRQVFIPGFMHEIAQEKINRNTSSRAIQEINSMQDYGYPFKTEDGTEIYSSMDGRFWSNGQEISKEKAIRVINKSMIVEDAINNLKYNFTNNEGTLYDKDGYEKMARMIAVKAANELNPNISFENDITIDEIFNKKGIGSIVSNKYASTMQYELYDKYNDVFDIYDKIMSAIINN